MDGSFYVWPESMVHLWVHDLSDDPVHARLQHTRSRKTQQKQDKTLMYSGTFLKTAHKESQ